MKAIFKFTPKDFPSSKILAEDLTSQEDFQKFLRGNIGESLTVEVSQTNIQSEKERIYGFYHKVVLGVAIQVFTNDGYVGVDKVVADYMLKAECGKEIIFNSKTGQEEVYLLDKRSMNKKRLIKYVTDCVMFLQTEKGANVPDSSEYLMELRTGIPGFRSVNSKK